MLDLGAQPLANEMGRTAEEVLQEFPLHLRVCRTCGLGQVGEFVLPERIFAHDYPYLSSTSISWMEHARRYARRFTQDLGLAGHEAGTSVIEIASNDGYLLSSFQRLGVKVLGVEPADNVAAIAAGKGVPTVNEFFGTNLARRLVAEHGRFRLVVANNVLAHVPDLHDFIAGLAELCDADTLVTVENPSFLALLRGGQFDTIYHEHFSYLTAHAVSRAARDHGLDLVSVEQLQTHGGSNRYHLRRTGSTQPDLSVERVLHEERNGGLFDPELWKKFAKESLSAIDGLRAWLDERRSLTVAGYGAAAKANTFLNAVGPAARNLEFVVDASIEKQGRFLPGSRLPVFPPHALRDREVADVLILPWNLAEELQPIVHALAPTAGVWVAMPEMRQLR